MSGSDEDQIAAYFWSTDAGPSAPSPDIQKPSDTSDPAGSSSTSDDPKAPPGESASPGSARPGDLKQRLNQPKLPPSKALADDIRLGLAEITRLKAELKPLTKKREDLATKYERLDREWDFAGRLRDHDLSGAEECWKQLGDERLAVGDELRAITADWNRKCDELKALRARVREQQSRTDDSGMSEEEREELILEISRLNDVYEHTTGLGHARMWFLLGDYCPPRPGGPSTLYVPRERLRDLKNCMLADISQARENEKHPVNEPQIPTGKKELEKLVREMRAEVRQRLHGEWFASQALRGLSRDGTVNGIAEADLPTALRRLLDGRDNLPPIPAANDGSYEKKKLGHMPVFSTAPRNFDPRTLPRFEWVLGHTALVGAVMAIVGPSSASKSTYALERAISIITGRELTGETVHKRGPVAVYNAEDPIEVMHKRVAAICQHHGIPLTDVLPHLRMASGQDYRFVITLKKNDRVARAKGVAELIESLREKGVVHLILDPLIDLGLGISENSNDEMQEVTATLRDIARKARVSIDVVHHTPKQASTKHGDLNAARGAGSFGAAVRGAITVMPMEPNEVTARGLHGRVIRVDMAKMNYAAFDDQPRLFRLISVQLNNGTCTEEGAIFGDGDTIGVHELIDQSTLAEANASAAEEHQQRVLSAIADATKEAKTSLTAVIPGVQTKFRIGKTKAREVIMEVLPPGRARDATASDGSVWDLKLERNGSHQTAPVWISRSRPRG